MNETVLTTIAFTGFTVAFFHAAIPTHWLPFVAAGRAQRWTHTKTLLITALAGTGHVLATALLGSIVTILGVALSWRIWHRVPANSGSIADRHWSILHLATALGPCSQPHSLIFKGRSR